MTRNVKEGSPRPRVDRLDPGKVKPVTLIGAMVTAALLKLCAPPHSQPAPFQPAPFQPALPATHVQVVAARSAEPAELPRTRSPSCAIPAPQPQPTRRWLCPQEVGAETAPPTPARRTHFAGF